MKFAKTVLAAAAMALACGAALAADKENKKEKGFNEIDKNADGYITRAEATAAGRKDLIKRWKEADGNNDGKLSRAEYLKLMAKDDFNTVKEKVSGAPEAAKKETAEAKRRAPDANASTGSSADAKTK
jgi:Ca2+-binding EF-hand superfamily protein